MVEDAELLSAIELDAEAMVASGDVEREYKNTIKLLLGALLFGCNNTDKLAGKLGLARDRFVRPRAKRLRASGVWRPDGYTCYESEDDSRERTIELILHVLCAEGIVRKSPEGIISLVEEPILDPIPSGVTGV